MNYLLLFMFWFCAGTANADAAEIQQSPIYIDVRTPGEYESGHLNGARNLDFDTIGRQIHALTTDRNAPIILYCKTGRRSGFAKETLESMGYVNVVNAGGLNDVLRQYGGIAVTGPAECPAAEC